MDPATPSYEQFDCQWQLQKYVTQATWHKSAGTGTVLVINII